jgi:hypothetical protein
MKWSSWAFRQSSIDSPARGTPPQKMACGAGVPCTQPCYNLLPPAAPRTGFNWTALMWLQVFVIVQIHIVFFWIMTPCKLVGDYQRVGETAQKTVILITERVRIAVKLQTCIREILSSNLVGTLPILKFSRFSQSLQADAEVAPR